MALNYVLLTLDIFDGQGGIPQAGTVTFTPSAVLLDTTDHQTVQQGPVTAQFNGTTAPIVRLLATDNAALAPPGWGWQVSFSGMVSSSGQPYQPASFSFLVAFANGASQFLSSVQQVSSPAALVGVTPLTAYGQQQLATQRSVALTPFLAALANRQFAPCSIVCIGDSITEGQHAQLPPYGFINRWINRLQDVLRAQFPVPLFTGGGRGFIGAQSTGTNSFTWPTTITGTPPNVGTSPKSGGLQLNTAGQTITFNLIGDACDLMWCQAFGGGTFSWAVDGGTPTNISTNGAGTVDGKLTRISLGLPGPHSLTVAYVSGGGSNIDGVIEYYGDAAAGILVHDAAHFGTTASSWVTFTAASPAVAIAALNPALIIISLGVNDQFAAVTPATFLANLQTVITQIKAKLTAPFPSFVLQMYPPRSGQSGYTFPWAQYVAAAWSVAQLDTSGPAGQSLVTVLDYTLGPRLPGADTDAYGIWQSGDLVHPSDKGHQAIADAICRFLTQG